MFGFVFGTACLVGLAAMAGPRRGCHDGRWGHHHGHHAWHRGGRWGHPGEGPQRRRGPWSDDGFARAAGEVLKRKLRIDEDQEGIVDHALGDVRASVKEAADELRDTRATVAEAFRGEVVDDAALAAAFSRQDEAIARARREVVSAFKQIHAVLDPEQRARAAELLGAARPGWV